MEDGARTGAPVSRRWKRALGAVGVVIVVNAVLALIGSFTGASPGGATASSYATGDDGLAGYASLLAKAGHPIRRVRRSAADASLDPRTTLVLIDPAFVPADDAQA